MDTRFCFSEKEFALLLEGSQIKEYYGIGIAQCLNVKEEEIPKVIFQMIKKGLVQVKEQSYQMTEKVEQLFLAIREATKTILIVSATRNQTMKCIYMGRRSIVVEYGGILHGLYKVYEKEWKTVIEEALQEEFEIAVLEKEQMVEMGIAQKCTIPKQEWIMRLQTQVAKKGVQVTENFTKDGLRILLELRNCEGKKRVFYLVEEPLENSVYWLEGDSVYKSILLSEKILELLQIDI